MTTMLIEQTNGASETTAAPATSEKGTTTQPGYRGLRVWQRAVDLGVEVYQLTRAFPKSEQYALTTQLRRAATSVVGNIAEGNARYAVREYTHHLAIAHGSTAEVEALVHLATRLGYATEAASAPVLTLCAEVGRMLRSLTKVLQSPPKGRS